jgi:ribosomal protein S27E
MAKLMEGKCPLCAHGYIVYDRRKAKMTCNDCRETFSP